MGNYAPSTCSSRTQSQPHVGVPKAVYHVGDTPFDVLAARHAGAVPVGVTTGVFTADDLVKAVPETLLVQNFADLALSLKLFGM
jgi:phosphoglycolate phosphatase-like HAD superfamily hydrolase